MPGHSYCETAAPTDINYHTLNQSVISLCIIQAHAELSLHRRDLPSCIFWLGADFTGQVISSSPLKALSYDSNVD